MNATSAVGTDSKSVIVTAVAVEATTEMKTTVRWNHDDTEVALEIDQGTEIEVAAVAGAIAMMLHQNVDATLIRGTLNGIVNATWILTFTTIHTAIAMIGAIPVGAIHSPTPVAQIDSHLGMMNPARPIDIRQDVIMEMIGIAPHRIPTSRVQRHREHPTGDPPIDTCLTQIWPRRRLKRVTTRCGRAVIRWVSNRTRSLRAVRRLRVGESPERSHFRLQSKIQTMVGARLRIKPDSCTIFRRMKRLTGARN